MKKTRPLIISFIAAFLGCAAMASCAESEDDRLIMVTDADFPPFEYFSEEGNIIGLDIEVAEAIAEKLSVSLEVESISFDRIVDEVENGKYDLGMAALTVNEERKAKVLFSDTYAKGVQSVIVRADSVYNKIEDFYTGFDDLGNPSVTKAGITIGVQKNTTGDKYACDPPIKWGFGETNVKKYNTGEEAAQALSDGKITAVIIDNEPASAFVEKYNDLRIMDTPYADEDYAICVNKSNYELLGKINKALKELKSEGKLDEIINKYLPEADEEE